MSLIVVLDLGTGNLRSVAQAAQHEAAAADKVEISRDPEQITQADRIILPGQGAIGSWLTALSDDRLKTALSGALNNKPVLAICVGMQALFEYNDEDGGHSCLGLFSGNIRRFADGQTDSQGLPMKVPQMGWNQISITQSHPLWNGIPDGSWFYFLHSYYADASVESEVFAHTTYGFAYASAVAKSNIFAIQCHPEKSHNAGLRLMRNFLNWKI